MWRVAESREDYKGDTMKKLLFLALLLPGILLAEGDYSVDDKVVELIITKKPSVIKEENKRKSKRDILPYADKAVCSGSLVSDQGDILTARHCVVSAEYIDVVLNDKREYRATVVKVSDKHDLAWIRIDELTPAHFKFATQVGRGQRIFVLGSPLAISNTLATGIVAKISGDIMLIDCSALPGNSGGPVLNEDGEIIGVVVAGFWVGFGTTHLNIAQSLASVYFFFTR